MALNPPSGIVKWFNTPLGERGWNSFRAQLTGKDYPGTSRKTSYVKLSDKEAEEVISNIKKDPEGIPLFDEANAPDKAEEYQRWLVARYLTKSREEGFEDRKKEGTKQLEEELGPEGLDELLNLIREESKVEVDAGVGGGGGSSSGTPPPPQPPSSSALAVVPKKEDDLVEEEIDSQILSILGLEDVFDLTYEEYYRELRTAAAAGRMPGSQMSTESIELITEELKRVKGKTGRFKVKQKKIDINKVLDRKQPTPPGAIIKAEKLIPPSPIVDEKTTEEVEDFREAIIDELDTIGNKLDELLNQIRSDDKKEKKEKEKARIDKEKEKKRKKESQLESRKSSVSKVFEKVTKPFVSFFDRIKQFFMTILIGSAVKMLYNLIKDPSSILNPIKNFINSIIGFLNGIIAFLWNMVISPINFVINSINSGISSLIDNINKAITLIPGAKPITAPQIKPLPGPPQQGVIPTIPIQQQEGGGETINTIPIQQQEGGGETINTIPIQQQEGGGKTINISNISLMSGGGKTINTIPIQQQKSRGKTININNISLMSGGGKTINTIPIQQQKGSNTIPIQQQKGSNTIPIQQQEGGGETINTIPIQQQKGSNTIPIQQQKGSNTIPIQQQKGRGKTINISNISLMSGGGVDKNTGLKISGFGKDTQLTALSPGEVVFSNPAADFWGRDKLLAMNAMGGGDNTPKIGKLGISAMSGGGVVIGAGHAAKRKGSTVGTDNLPVEGTTDPRTGVTESVAMMHLIERMQRIVSSNPQLYSNVSFSNITETKGPRGMRERTKAIEGSGKQFIELHLDQWGGGRSGVISRNLSSYDKNLINIFGDFGRNFKQGELAIPDEGGTIVELGAIDSKALEPFLDEVKANKYGPATDKLATTLLQAVVAATPPSAPNLPPPTTRPVIAPLPIPTGTSSRSSIPSSSASANQAQVPSFSSDDPNNSHLLVVKSIYNLVG